MLDAAGRCTFVNRAACALLGYEASDLLGRDLHDLIHHRRPDGSPYPREACPVVAASESGVATPGADETLWCRDGEPLPVEYAASPLRRGGQVVGVVVVFSDATERRRVERERLSLLERERTARRDAEQAVRIRDEVLAVVSHDLRNPLNAILMSAELMDMRMEQGVEDFGRVRKQIGLIRRSVEQASRLIRDLLEVGRIQRGRLTISPERCDAARLVVEAVELNEPLAAEKGIVLEAHAAPHAGKLAADRDRIQQVFSNLVANAIRFTPADGHIRLGAEAAADDAVRFDVADEGAGIPEDELPSLFVPFWQGRSAPRQGAGLGLAICRGIVEAHGGRIEAESRPGEGTTIRFWIPRAANAPAAGSPPVPPPAPAPAGPETDAGDERRAERRSGQEPPARPRHRRVRGTADERAQ